MKKTNRNFFLTIGGILLIALLLSFKNETADDKIIMIRTSEPVNKYFSSILIVTDGSTILKTIDLAPTKLDNLENNALKITAVLNEYKSQGFSIISQSGSLDAAGITTYILEKK